MQHFIGKQLIELQLPDTTEAFELQQQFSHVFQQTVAPAMEDLFDLYSTPDEVLYIDRLVIDIGAIDARQLRTDAWSLRVIQELQKVLENAQGNHSTDLIQKTSTARSEFDRWLQLLNKGYLPLKSRLPENLEDTIIQSLQQDPTCAGRLKQTLKSNPNAVLRLAMQHQAAFLKFLLRQLASVEPTVIHNSFAAWEAFWRHCRRLISLETKAFEQAAGKHGKAQIQELLQRIKAAMQQMARHWGESASLTPDLISGEGSARHTSVWFWSKWLKTVVESHSNQIGNTQQVFEILFQKLLTIKELELVIRLETSHKQPALNAIETWVESNIKTIPTGIQAQPVLDEKEPLSPSLPERDEDEEAPFPAPEPGEVWYLDGAGVVLLHPFLSAFFQRLGLVKNGAFTIEERRQKAVLLIHYLMSGATNPSESELLLPKILCGVPMHQPVDTGLKLKKKELAEAEALLSVVIEHWGVLGNASPEALREGFLSRAGKLENHALGRQLKIERQTLDLLLDQLPWGIGMIRLPWMPELIIVEW
ncbi:MAG: hypothetical protein JNJ57_06335 [Saprospiraceae bacterium]|nr:hypothetical protein [Saprospiraceae bacterium]